MTMSASGPAAAVRGDATRCRQWKEKRTVVGRGRRRHTCNTAVMATAGFAHRDTMEYWPVLPGSLRLDARSLDDGPPLRNLGLLGSAQRLGSLLLAWRNTLSEIGESLAHQSPTSCFDNCIVEICDYSLGSAFGNP